MDDGGSERPAGASRATDADSAPEARSSLADGILNKTFQSYHTWLGLADKATKYQECRQTSRYETDWRTGILAATAICQRERVPRHDRVASINLYNASGGYFYYRKAGLTERQTRIDLRIRNHFTEKMCDAHLEDCHLMSAQRGFSVHADSHDVVAWLSAQEGALATHTTCVQINWLYNTASVSGCKC